MGGSGRSAGFEENGLRRGECWWARVAIQAELGRSVTAVSEVGTGAAQVGTLRYPGQRPQVGLELNRTH